jgi:hypothetical protein
MSKCRQVRNYATKDRNESGMPRGGSANYSLNVEFLHTISIFGELHKKVCNKLLPELFSNKDHPRNYSPEAAT